MDRARGWAASKQGVAGGGGASEQPIADGWGWRFLAFERDFGEGKGCHQRSSDSVVHRTLAGGSLHMILRIVAGLLGQAFPLS